MESLSDYDYNLPPQAVAQRPLANRSDSKLLWLPRYEGEPMHRRFRDISKILQPGDLLVMNDTRVTALRLFGKKPTGGEVELLLLRQTGPCEFFALAKPGRRLQPGTEVQLEGRLKATIAENLGAGKRIVFEPLADLSTRLQQVGRVPLPPYIHEELADPERYQTVYSREGGSAAAPTAGLHFTPELLEELDRLGVRTAKVTLDVGFDTFRPVESNDLSAHQMHGERCRVPEETAQAIADSKGRVIGVGTTTVRTLETMAEGPKAVKAGGAQSRLFIRPGYRFQIVDGLFTNFHMPRTTMLMMISAMAGRERVMNAYAVALQCGYRFLSFGDSMLIL